MANSMFRKAMAYLGLVDDEYDEFDGYDGRDAAPAAPPRSSRESRNAEPDPEPERAGATIGRIRPISREDRGGAQLTAVAPPQQSSVRPMPADSPKVHIVAPANFGDAKEIADVLKANRPVIVNLQMSDRDLQRRMIDFCSGVAYALSGDMEKVADQVFLLAPSNVTVSDEERARLQSRGFDPS